MKRKEPEPAQVPPFKSSEEVGAAWHECIGYGDGARDESKVEQQLKANPLFASRVLATDERFFFGTAKELLLQVARRLADAPADGSQRN